MRTLLFQNEPDLGLIIGEGKAFALFYDTGRLPDGNALLPREPVPIEGFETLVGDGRASLVSVIYGDSEEVVERLGIHPEVLSLARERDDWTMFINAVECMSGLWAHFGVYGSPAEVWIIAGEEYKSLRREGAAATPECQGQGSAEKKFGDKDIPIVKCFKMGGNVEFWCPFCHCWHTHFARGEWEGWVQAYCTPFRDKGYFLTAYTEGELKRIREKAEG